MKPSGVIGPIKLCETKETAQYGIIKRNNKCEMDLSLSRRPARLSWRFLRMRDLKLPQVGQRSQSCGIDSCIGCFFQNLPALSKDVYVPACKDQRTTSLADREPCPLQLLVHVQETFHSGPVNGLNGVMQAYAPSAV